MQATDEHHADLVKPEVPTIRALQELLVAIPGAAARGWIRSTIGSRKWMEPPDVAAVLRFIGVPSGRSISEWRVTIPPACKFAPCLWTSEWKTSSVEPRGGSGGAAATGPVATTSDILIEHDDTAPDPRNDFVEAMETIASHLWTVLTGGATPAGAGASAYASASPAAAAPTSDSATFPACSPDDPLPSLPAAIRQGSPVVVDDSILAYTVAGIRERSEAEGPSPRTGGSAYEGQLGCVPCCGLLPSRVAANSSTELMPSDAGLSERWARLLRTEVLVLDTHWAAGVVESAFVKAEGAKVAGGEEVSARKTHTADVAMERVNACKALEAKTALDGSCAEGMEADGISAEGSLMDVASWEQVRCPARGEEGGDASNAGAGTYIVG